ncbi:hypothetical protein THASP1DRAFT_24510 [Thamnocephalis sphaerospora]|uniref:Uncharacterized protein n=1 Tax=Thamnocephalis sphaerospora TaxID=78915 RepID=A0A4P9XN28_9FUNG|nr:hypothetical protein THASP1DRAFT_24510 [Thamnocephalis sphaerospora]|eukprot:RKP07328.1 hypothetical protein THASP1DRAFT_24510 [Thamnocephalis sphaerospora]
MCTGAHCKSRGGQGRVNCAPVFDVTYKSHTVITKLSQSECLPSASECQDHQTTHPDALSHIGASLQNVFHLQWAQQVKEGVAEVHGWIQSGVEKTGLDQLVDAETVGDRLAEARSWIQSGVEKAGVDQLIDAEAIGDRLAEASTWIQNSAVKAGVSQLIDSKAIGDRLAEARDLIQSGVEKAGLDQLIDAEAVSGRLAEARAWIQNSAERTGIDQLIDAETIGNRLAEARGWIQSGVERTGLHEISAKRVQQSFDGLSDWIQNWASQAKAHGFTHGKHARSFFKRLFHQMLGWVKAFGAYSPISMKDMRNWATGLLTMIGMQHVIDVQGVNDFFARAHGWVRNWNREYRMKRFAVMQDIEDKLSRARRSALDWTGKNIPRGLAKVREITESIQRMQTWILSRIRGVDVSSYTRALGINVVVSRLFDWVLNWHRNQKAKWAARASEVASSLARVLGWLRGKISEAKQNAYAFTQLPVPAQKMLQSILAMIVVQQYRTDTRGMAWMAMDLLCMIDPGWCTYGTRRVLGDLLLSPEFTHMCNDIKRLFSIILDYLQNGTDIKLMANESWPLLVRSFHHLIAAIGKAAQRNFLPMTRIFVRRVIRNYFADSHCH